MKNKPFKLFLILLLFFVLLLSYNHFKVEVDEEILKSSDPIYSEAYDIEDVWKLGKQIKTLNKNMPDEREIIFLGKEEPKSLSKVYEVKKVYEYQKVTHDMERLYILERIY